MKKNIIVIMAAMLMMAGCYKRDINDALEAKLAPVENIDYNFFAGQDSVRISWTNPNTETGLSTVVRHTDGVMILPGNQTSLDYGIIQTNKEYAFTIKLKDSLGDYSLGKTIRFTRSGAGNVQQVAFVQEEDTLFVSWKLPADETLKNVIVSWTSSEVSGEQVLEGSATSLKLVGLPLGNYKFSFSTINSQDESSHTLYQQFRIGPTKIAFLSQYPDIQSIPDDDELAAAQWFADNITNSDYITFDQILDGTADLNQYRVIWWHHDEIGGATLPAISKNPIVVDAINNYYKAGGNLLLSIHATMYLEVLGRIPDEGFSNGKAIGDGQGGDNPDVWAISVNLKAYDYSNHPLYQGLVINNTGNNGKEIPLIGPGWKEDHNSAWTDLPAANGFNNDDDTFIPYLETTYGVKMLGAWGHVRDYFMVGIGEFMPFGQYEGTAITIGLGAYEWNQNNGTNPNQQQIRKLTRNALEYLKSK
jgi:hypothetical protein